MPRLTIDNRKITVEPGTKVIEAAERLGIMIPRFCFHPALGSVGACRVCAVKVIEGPSPGLRMSCMIDAEEDMVVSTTDPEAVELRKSVIEWLMVNHPHDCPVCDEGGHCLLQDTTVAGGHGRRRYGGKKRTHRDQDLGPLVQHEMNRCIQCYRCTRYYREFAGYPDLGVMGIGSRVYFGRTAPGTLESPFAGNLTEICPTGVYTDKPSRFKGRRWDFERCPSVCIHCSLGCHTVVSARYREVVRHEARFCPEINGHFICDRGRWGFAYVNAAHRPRRIRLDGRETHRTSAVEAAAERIRRIVGQWGAGAVAAAGSARCSVQTLAALHRLCALQGWREPAVFPDAATAERIRAAAGCMAPDAAVTLGNVPAADCIVVVGADPVNEAPMLALALRQAVRNGAGVTVIDPRPVALPFAFDHVPTPPWALADRLDTLVTAIGERESADETAPPLLATAARRLLASRRPLIVCGTAVADVAAIRRAAILARALKTSRDTAGLFYLMPGANALGAILMAGEPSGFDAVLEGIEAGTIRALILAESDPFWSVPDRERLAAAMEKLELLVVLDYLNSPAARAAHLLVPTTTVYESGGIFVNQTGTAQWLPPVLRGGAPVAETGGGDHPPRTFSPEIPGEVTDTAAAFLSELSRQLAAPGTFPADDPVAWLAASRPRFAPLAGRRSLPDAGIGLAFESAPEAQADRENDTVTPTPPTDSLCLLLVEWTFGTEELSRYSPCLQQRETAPRLAVSAGDADLMGLATGDTVAIETDTAAVKATVRVVDGVAAGVAVLPMHRQLAWQEVGGTAVTLNRNRIRKLSGK